MSGMILDGDLFCVCSSLCPSDETIDHSGSYDDIDMDIIDNPEVIALTVLEQPTGTLITGAGTDSRALRTTGGSAGSATNIFPPSNTAGGSAGAGQSVDCAASGRADGATANIAGKEDPPQE